MRLRAALSQRPHVFAWFGALLLYVVAALACSWPLAPQLYTHLPLGSLGNGTVPLFNVWTLEWNVQSLARAYRGYWDAPIFYPNAGSFALSETQALTGWGFAALRPLFGSVAGYNLILLANLVLNAFGARRTLRVLGAASATATLSGLLALALPFVWKELGVLQLTAFWPLWYALAELALLARASPEAGPPPRAAAPRLAVFCAATLWTCSYYALFFAVFLLLWAALFVRRELFRPPAQRAPILGAALLLLALAAPLLLSQPRLMHGYSRSAETIRDGSASARGYLRLPRAALGGELLPFMRGQPERRSLSPGAVACGLALCGVWLARRRLRRRFVIWCAASLGLALLLSFGSRWSIGPWTPYSIVEQYWPGFAHVRTPYRFAAFVQLFTLLFAGLGLEALRVRLGARRELLLWPVVLLGLLEVVPFGARLTRFPSEPLRAPWVRYLAEQPGGAVVMIPPALSNEASAYEATVVAMLQGLRHGHPLLNGYSGFFPKSVHRLTQALRGFPNPRSQRLLGRVPARWAVIDKAWLGERDPAPMRLVLDGDEQALYALPEADSGARSSSSALPRACRYASIISASSATSPPP